MAKKAPNGVEKLPKALDELEREKGEASSVGNYRIIVVGQQTMKPRAVKVPLRN